MMNPAGEFHGNRPAMKRQWQFIAIALFAPIISWIYFAPFIHNFFAYDSFRYIENLFAGPKAVMVGYNAFRVVSNFIWYPLYAISGFDPTGYSLFNCSLFAVNAVLLYLLTVKLWGDKGFSLLAATLFVLNATPSDAVFWHMSMSTLFCTALYLLTLIVYVTYRQGGNNRYRLGALALYTVTMFTKEDAASFPLVVALIEVFYFNDLHDVKGLLKRVTPYCLVIVGYIVISNSVFFFLGVELETAKFFKFRPYYALFGGFSAFFLAPDGRLDLSAANPYIYLTVIAAIAAFFLVRDRKLLLFGYIWILVTFLPQSLSAIGQFEPKYIFNSISRLLYLPGVGVSIVLALLLSQLDRVMPKKAALVATGVLLALFFSMNYSRVQKRGTEWMEEAEPVRVFLTELKKLVPQLPRNTYFYSINGPTGRAYMQQSLRACYGNPTITWIVDPTRYLPKPGETALIFDVAWMDRDRIYRIDIVPFSLEAINQRMR